MTHRKKHRISRRHALVGAGSAGAAWAAREMLATQPATASDEDPHSRPLLVFFRFGGGWDTLLSLDPRDHTQAKYSMAENKIHTNYGAVADGAMDAADDMANSGNSGIIKPPGSNLGFGLAMREMAKHHQDICLVRGIDMGTLTHTVGARYFMTGKFPRGLAASGSSLSTWWANEQPGLFTIPNLVIRTETFNEGLDPRASGLRIDGFDDLATVLKPLQPELEPRAALSSALAALQHSEPCLATQLDTTGHIAAHRASFEKALALSGGKVWETFNFQANPEPDSSMAKLYEAFGINPGNPYTQLRSGAGRAAIAAQALTAGLSQSVTLAVTGSLDTHGDNWATQQYARQREGWDAIARFISYMKNTLDPNGKPYWDRITLIACSEFARTPRINAGNGRDHFLYSGALLAGKGILGNTVVGATSDYDYHAMPIVHETGALDSQGAHIRPPDVHATLLAAAGLSYEHISNQEPVLLQSIMSS